MSCLAAILSACGDGGVTDNVNGRDGMDHTRLTLKVTDAPLDLVTEVWIQFTAVDLKPLDADSLHFELASPQNINLLSLTGAKSEILLQNVSIPSGDYEWIRLAVNASRDGIQDSYVRLLDGSEPELDIPSGSTSGLQVGNGFTADAAIPLQLTIDFDLRKSIAVTGSGDYIFRPTLQLIDDSIAGTLGGTIDTDLLTDDSCSDDDPTTGNAVYVFSGNNITPDDIDNILPEPYTTTTIQYNDGTGEYEYEVGFLPEGKYTVAFTCESDNDELNSNDPITFISISRNVNVTHSEDYTNTFR